MDSLIIKAPAKVNTLLRVTGRRENGYHDLQMVMVPLSLSDEITLTKISNGIEFGSDGATDAGMVGEKNLAYRAARILAEAAGVNTGVKIYLQKKIPVAAGLGGGSSDAASVLKGLNYLWNINWPAEKLAELGARLGADVPFFCYGGPAFVEGIGDKVRPYKEFPNLSLLLINPGFAVPTPWVYKQWDLQLTPKAHNVKSPPHFNKLGDVVKSLHNDLEAVTIPAYSEIALIKDKLSELGAVGALMSGSGPTVFGVFENESSRDKALSFEFKKNWRVFLADVR